MRVKLERCYVKEGKDGELLSEGRGEYPELLSKGEGKCRAAK